MECNLIKDQDTCDVGGTDGKCFWNNSICSPWKC